MKKRLIIALLTLFVSALTGFAQDEHKKAMEFYKEGRFQDALAMLEESISTYPDWYFPVLMKGQTNLKLGNYKEAVSNFNDAMTLEIPGNELPKARYGIAQAYMFMEDYPKAIHAFDELIPLTPPSRLFDVYFSRAQSEMQVAKAAEDKNDRNKANSYYSKAIVSYSEALKHPVNDEAKEVEALFQKAFSQYKIGNFEGGIASLEKSIQAFQNVIAENPKEKRAHQFLINLSFEIVEKSPDTRKPDRYGDAVGYIDRYLSHWPGDAAMINKKGLALQGARQYKEAINVFKSLVRMQPENGEAYFSLGSCQMAAKQYQEAIASFNKALAKGQEKNPNVYLYSAYCFQEQKSSCENLNIPFYESAVSILEKGLTKVSGTGKAMIQKDLGNKKSNLEILRTNFSTENQNHQVVIENITQVLSTM
jgi:tetratricopeptide (TPR) repeat protein